jgi:hypothetical protein
VRKTVPTLLFALPIERPLIRATAEKQRFEIPQQLRVVAGGRHERAVDDRSLIGTHLAPH